MTILALDIDDCIFPSNNSYFGRLDDALDILKLNMKRIQLMLTKYDMRIFITSSWSINLNLINNNLEYNNRHALLEDKAYYNEEAQAFEILKNTLDGYVIGLSCGDRYKDIKLLLESGHKVVAFDDMDLSFEMLDVDKSIEINYKFVQLKGFITNDKTYEINKFLQDKTK